MFYKGNEDREKQLRFSIRKVSFGAASVAVAALFMFPGNGTVSATEQGVTPTNEGRQGSPLKEPDVQNGTYGATPVVSQLDGNSGSSEASAPKNQEGTSTPTSTDASAPSVESPTVSATEEKSAEKNTEVPSTEANSVENKEQTRVKTEEKAATPVTESHKPKLRKKRDISATPDADVATDDPSANQTYTAPSADASVNQLAKALQDLPDKVENNDKLSKNMENLGASKNVSAGQVLEIDEFGGWKAVGENGKFVIARKTAAGVFPLETINSTLDDTVWLTEQSFDRTSDYTLLLSKSRTRANMTDVVADGSNYRELGEGTGITKNVVNFQGIEKVFKAYSTELGTNVVVKFKTGYAGDSEGKKANYKVEVFSIAGTTETKVYETTFDPQKNSKDNDKVVTKASDGTNNSVIRISTTSNGFVRGQTKTRQNFIGKEAAEKKIAEPGNVPNGTPGTFTSRNIELPKGVEKYKVRISLANQNETGMSYQAWDLKYSLPITGVDFTITQETNAVAKSLLQRVYDKLKETEEADTKGKTETTINAYKAQLENVKNLLEGDLKATQDYKKLVTDVLTEQAALRTDKSGLTTSKQTITDLIDETPEPTSGKTPRSVTAYTAAKEEAKKAQAAAQAVLDKDNPSSDEVELAISKLNEKIAELRLARSELVTAATDDQKDELSKVEETLKPADTADKTPKSVEAYNKEIEKLQAELDAAKRDAKAVVDKGEEATKAEASEAQVKVAAVRAKLVEAGKLLTDKADKADLTAAKTELDELAKADVATDDKTTSTKAAYDTAKQAAEEAVTEATKVINNEDATSEEVATALANVKAKKAELDKAKAGLVDKITDTQKDELSKVEETLKPVDTADKTPKSVEAYNKEIEKLQAELDAAKRDAKAVVDKGEEATKAEASEAQVKVAAVRAKLVEAGKLLTDKADKADLTAARAIDEINRINPIPSPRHLLTTNNQPGNSSNVNTTEPTSPSDSGQANSGQDGRSTDSGSTTTARSSVAPVTTTEPSANTANREDDTVRSATQGQGILDKSELSKQTQTLENLLRLLTGVSNPTTDSARLVLVEAKKALADDSLTEQGLRHILQTVKDAIASLESIKESQSATKDGGQTAGKETAGEDESANQTQVPVGIIAASILVLLGLLFFLLARRNKESELEKLVKELSKLLKDLNLETVDKDILENSQEELQKAVLFLADEKGSEHTEAELIDNLKEVIAKLTANA
ncbi:YSIRK-type signal peptide-containing protein [Streptococcus pseudopneumoniae]|uniref:YSIRK-type signal peptide-containing protein n=1 Tax=Streptococcus pseudopneumoniae TaxID=257758 RepID=UPI002015F1C8|nr:YSIRK-type signal peptide-containing protein [Streptococcus pseudopneumoniae]